MLKVKLKGQNLNSFKREAVLIYKIREITGHSIYKQSHDNRTWQEILKGIKRNMDLVNKCLRVKNEIFWLIKTSLRPKREMSQGVEK